MNADLKSDLNPCNRRLVDDAGLALHFLEGLRDEGGDLEGFFAAVRIGLVEIEVWEGETTQRGVVVVAGVEADGAVRNINAVATEATAQGQQRRRGVAEDAGFPAVVLVEIHVAHP